MEPRVGRFVSAILVVDDHGVYRAGLRGVIQARFPGSRVVEAPKLSCTGSNRCFDLVLIDSGSLSYETLDLLAEFHEMRPATRFAVMLTAKARTDVLHYLSAGFHGVMHKLQPAEELLAAIDDLLSGRIYVPGWIADAVDEDPGRPSPADISRETSKAHPPAERGAAFPCSRNVEQGSGARAEYRGRHQQNSYSRASACAWCAEPHGSRVYGSEFVFIQRTCRTRSERQAGRN